MSLPGWILELVRPAVVPVRAHQPTRRVACAAVTASPQLRVVRKTHHTLPMTLLDGLPQRLPTEQCLPSLSSGSSLVRPALVVWSCSYLVNLTCMVVVVVAVKAAIRLHAVTVGPCHTMAIAVVVAVVAAVVLLSAAPEAALSPLLNRVGSSAATVVQFCTLVRTRLFTLSQ